MRSGARRYGSSALPKCVEECDVCRPCTAGEESGQRSTRVFFTQESLQKQPSVYCLPPMALHNQLVLDLYT